VHKPHHHDKVADHGGATVNHYVNFWSDGFCGDFHSLMLIIIGHISSLALSACPVQATNSGTKRRTKNGV